ncbi:MAG: glycosyltransferase family 2 protein [Candidatus Omnitrophota bacterium]
MRPSPASPPINGLLEEGKDIVMNDTPKDSSSTERSLGFSIIIPVYNGEKTLPDTLRSVSSLEGGPFEIVVVDDGSTDRTPDIAREYNAVVVRMDQNQGPAAARNMGARFASHDILVFTDSDVLLPKRLLGIVAGHFNKTAADAVQGVFSEVCPFANYFSQYKNLYNRFVLTNLPDWIDTTFTSITAVRRAAFLDSGGFDEGIRGASVEDRTLGRNLRKTGCRIRLDRSIEVIHNKKLTCSGFIRNQFRRSRDLAKLMLRNRSEPPLPPLEQDAAPEVRFGTNSLSTMLRIPAAYLGILFCGIAFADPIFLVAAAFWALLFLHLIAPLEWRLLRRRGLFFALKGIPVNFLDAVASGLGIAAGLFDFFFLGKKF